jgi:outer membrane protein assembly factor BamA
VRYREVIRSLLFAVCILFCAIQTSTGQTVDSLYRALMADSIMQVDLIDYLNKVFKVKDLAEKRVQKKIHFSLFPSTSGISGDKTVFTSFNVAFLLGDLSNTNVSNIYFYPYIGFGGQYGFQLQPNIWLRRNSWHFIGDYFMLNYPQYTWGPGGNSSDENKTMIDYNHLRVHQSALKGIWPHFSAGIGYAYDYHNDITIEETAYSEEVIGYLPEPIDQSGSSGITLPILYDSRRNALNAQQGFMASFTYSFYDPVFGSDDRWQSIFYDMRKYFHIPGTKHNILALRSYYWTILSGTPPYLDLPSNRWEPISGSASRGIKQNRYRSNAILYFESEYRFGITKNGLIGGVVFANITAPSQYETQNFLYWHPAAGTGIRLKFNKFSNTNVAFDFGFSKGFASVYLNIGEAF